MAKNFFVILFTVILTGVAVWIFVQKNQTINTESNILQVAGLNSPSPSSAEKQDEKNIQTANQSVKLANGLEVQDLVIGPGPEVHSGDIAAVNYVGTLTSGQKFDSSYDRGQAFVIMLGAGKVIKGWDLGIPGMKIGGKRKLIIPPELGYGVQGVEGIIPPNSTLIFEVELLDARAGGGSAH